MAQKAVCWSVVSESLGTLRACCLKLTRGYHMYCISCVLCPVSCVLCPVPCQGRLRDDAAVALQAVGPEPVFHTVRAIAFARRYLADDNIDIVFSPAWSEIETDSGTTTGLHFAINTVG